MDDLKLRDMNITELKKLAKIMKIKGYNNYRAADKEALIKIIRKETRTKAAQRPASPQKKPSSPRNTKKSCEDKGKLYNPKTGNCLDYTLKNRRLLGMPEPQRKPVVVVTGASKTAKVMTVKEKLSAYYDVNIENYNHYARVLYRMIKDGGFTEKEAEDISVLVSELRNYTLYNSHPWNKLNKDVRDFLGQFEIASLVQNI